MGVFVYFLCALTSLLCAVMLLRGYGRTGVRLLLWSGLCFACFALNNVILIIDVQMLPDRDLSVLRTLPSLLGMGLLLYGLVWESDAR
ncbi:MAG: DUF5985 family protein [Gemmatimonadota bacterium]|nr:DUF5985 family protein [Gemmatimonadota bacterium]